MPISETLIELADGRGLNGRASPATCSGTSLIVLNTNLAAAQGTPTDPWATDLGTASNHGNVRRLGVTRSFTHLDVRPVWAGTLAAASGGKYRLFGLLPPYSPNTTVKFPHGVNAVFANFAEIGAPLGVPNQKDRIWIPLPDESGNHEVTMTYTVVAQRTAGQSTYIGPAVRHQLRGCVQVMALVTTVTTLDDGPGVLCGQLLSPA